MLALTLARLAVVHEPATGGAEAEVGAGQLAWAATGVVEAGVEASEAASAAVVASVEEVPVAAAQRVLQRLSWFRLTSHGS